jgi:preprotein translocase subunit SecD
VTGRDIAKARATVDENGQPAISVSMTDAGADRLKRATASNIGRYIAIVTDNVVRSAPRIDSAISREAQITGRFTPMEAEDLALILRSASFAAPLVVVERRTVGAAGKR